MNVGNTVARAAGIMLVSASLWAAAAAPASAWPIPLTGQDTAFLNITRGNFPGDDDTLLTAGRLACRQLMTGQSRQLVVDSIAGQFGADPGQASGLVAAAHSTYCTAAPS
jgi:hypothetical protein